MLHDQQQENWGRGVNPHPGCSCPPWRYNPRHPKPTDPDCEQHGELNERNVATPTP